MKNCEAGCNYFSGGEVRHHPDCVNYHESLSEMYDKKDLEIAKLRDALEEISTGANPCIINGKEFYHDPYAAAREALQGTAKKEEEK